MGKCPGRAAQAQETGQEEIPKQARACLGPSVWRIRERRAGEERLKNLARCFHPGGSVWMNFVLRTMRTH